MFVHLPQRHVGVHRRVSGVAGQRGRHVLAQAVRVVEQHPRATLVHGGGQIRAFRVFLPFVILRVRGPHARRLRDFPVEHAERIGCVRRHLRAPAVSRIVVDATEAIGKSLLHDECVARRPAVGDFAAQQAQCAVPCVVCNLQPVQRMHDGIAAGQRHGDQVGLHFHFTRQRPLRDDNQAERHVDDRTQCPDGEAEQPADPRDAHVQVRQTVQDAVEQVALRDDMDGDLLRRVDPSAQRHRPLCEMAELVRAHRLEFGEIEHVDECEPDLQMLERRPNQVQQRQVVEHGRIDPRTDEHLVRARRAGVFGDTFEEREQPRLLRARQFNAVRTHVLPDEKERLGQEYRQEQAAAAREPFGQPGRPAIQREPQCTGDCREREPRGQREIQQDEQREARNRQPYVAAIRDARTRESGRHFARPGRVNGDHRVVDPLA